MPGSGHGHLVQLVLPQGPIFRPGVIGRRGRLLSAAGRAALRAWTANEHTEDEPHVRGHDHVRAHEQCVHLWLLSSPTPQPPSYPKGQVRVSPDLETRPKAYLTGRDALTAGMRQDGHMAARGKASNDAEIDRLFDLPPERFTSARDELSNRLKAEGRAEEAAQVRSLRRPTVAAWAVNQVARKNREDVAELVDAGKALQQAQRKVLSGVKAGGFREAMERRRRVVTRLGKAAERLLAEAGKGSAGAIEAIGATLEAASLEEDVAEQVRAGRLSKEVPAPAGFGATGGLELVADQPPKAEPAPRADRARDSAAREAKELAAAAAQARRAAIKARGDADRLEAKSERLRQEAEETRVEAREASKRAREAETAAERAQSEADRHARRA